MRIVFHVLLLCLCLDSAVAAEAGNSPAAATAPALRFDPYNPVVLNEFAMQKIREKDFNGAAILLERATLLAPHDARIAHNLRMLRAWQAGKPLATTSVEPVPETGNESAAAEDAGALPLSIWPSR